MLLFPVAGSFPGFLIAAVFWGIGSGISGAAPAAYAADLAPKGMMAPALSMYRTIADLGYVIGPLLAWHPFRPDQLPGRAGLHRDALVRFGRDVFRSRSGDLAATGGAAADVEAGEPGRPSSIRESEVRSPKSEDRGPYAVAEHHVVVGADLSLPRAKSNGCLPVGEPSDASSVSPQRSAAHTISPENERRPGCGWRTPCAATRAMHVFSSTPARGRGLRYSSTTMAVTMPNMPCLLSAWLRMWQWKAQTPGSSGSAMQSTRWPGAMLTVS